MTEIVFDSSAYGSLKAAKAYSNSGLLSGSNIVCINLMLDIGRLNEGITSRYRKELPDRMISCGVYDFDKEMLGASIGEKSVQNIEMLLKNISDEKDIHIWYSESPQSMCGMYFVCNLLFDHDVNVYVLKCPDTFTFRSTTQFIHGWGMLQYYDIQNHFEELVKREEKLSQERIELYAMHWEKLVEENAPLRAVISGVPTSVGEDFYDYLILRELAGKPIEQNELIFRIMSETHFGVYGFWYKYRIRELIKNGLIEVVEDSDEEKNRILKRKY